MNSELLQGFYLGDLLVEPLKGQVTGTTGSVHIPPKAMEVLLCLANDPGELVTREHLITEVWGEGHGSAETLSHAVSEIRHALDDHPEEPVFIQTLPRRGYRLVVAPELASEHSSTIILGTQNGATVADVSLLENLKRRGVLETAIAYLIVGWLLIQIADIVFAQLLLPTWAGTFVTVLVIAGFPIAILLSWFLEFRDGKAVVDLSPLDARRRRFSRTYLSVISALGAAALLVYMFDQFVGLPEQGSTIAADTGDTDLVIADNTIAVLPFMNVDGSDESETFANGFVDDVINRLAHVPGLLVSSRGDAFTMQPNSASGDVRQRLRVARYLEGSVQMTGDRIRIMVQLIDSSTGFHVLSRTFDRDREDFFEIRDEVTELTVSSLRVTLPEDTQQLTATTTPGPNLDAYILYRRGVDEMHKPTSQETVASALDWFDAALEVDDEYAAAYAGKCDAHSQAYDIFKDPAVVPDAEADCARALALNPNLDIVHTALGQLYALVGDNEKARISFETALQQNDRSVPALIGLAEVQYALQDAAAAEETVEKAIGLQPGNWKPANWLGLFMYHQGRYKEAAEQFAAVVDLDPDNTLAVANLGASYMLSGEFERAAPAFERSIELAPRAANYSNLGLMYYYLGRYDEAAAAARSGIELAPDNSALWMNLGDILSAAHAAEESREAFRKADELASASLRINASDAWTKLDLAWINAMLDNRDSAFEFIADAADGLPEDPYVDYINGLILNRYNDTDGALTAFEEAVDKGYPPFMIAAEPHLRNLYDHPRFTALARDGG